MNRGDVYWINFEPSVGGEVKKMRPAVVVSNDFANKHLNRIQVVPLTTKIDKLYPSEAYITVKGKQHKAMTDQLTTVSKTRLMNWVCRISIDDMGKIEQAIKIHLSLL